MPETTEQTPVTFDPKAFIEKRNDGQRETRPAAEQPAAPAKPRELTRTDANQNEPTRTDAKATEPEAQPEHTTRAERRRERRHLEEIGRLKAQLELVQNAGKPAESTVSRETVPSGDPEPQRKDFATDAEFNRAVGRWDARQETQKTLAAKASMDEENQHFQEMLQKADEDMKSFNDWDKAREESIENGPEWQPANHPTLMALLANSDQMAGLLYYVARDHETMQRLLDLEKQPKELIKVFHKLEGKVEILYSDKRKAAGAQSEKPEKAVRTEERKSPEKAEQARASASVASPTPKPKPTSELSTRGGQAPVIEDPKPGSKSWMEQRNKLQYQR